MSKEDFIVKLHNLILSEASIEAIINVAAGEIDNPILATDCDLKCIAKSRHDIDDPVWDLMANWNPNQELPINERINRERLNERAQSALKPFVNDFDFSDHRVMDMVVRWKGKILGVIHVFEYDSKFDENTSLIVSELGRTLAFVMATQQTTGSRSLSSEEIALRYLLNGTSVSQWLLKNRLFTLEEPNRYAVVVAESMNPTSQGHLLSTSLSTLANALPAAEGLIYDNQVVILAQIPVRGGFFNWNRDKFRNVALSQQMRCAISDPFTNYHNLREFYLQSLKALQIGRRFAQSESLYMYEDVGFYEMLDNLDENVIGSTAKYPPLLALLEHDEKHGTTYFKDLFIYLQNDYSARKTAEALSVHKNTINYRISRISSIMGRDLTDNKFLFRLHLCVKIFYYQQANIFSEKYHIPEEFVRWPVI